MISHIAILCFLTSLVIADPVAQHIFITRGVGPRRTTFRELNHQHPEEEQPQSEVEPVQRSMDNSDLEPTPPSEPGQVIQTTSDEMPSINNEIIIREITLLTLAALTIYTIAQIIVSILESAFSIKISFLSTWNRLMRKAAMAVVSTVMGVGTNIVNTISGLFAPPGSPRNERALNDMSNMVYQAIDSFNRKYKDDD